jgi:AcrR family transcriptional regulator
MRTTIERPLRRDAERNRSRILEAARELFAEHGLGVSLDEIARHAGVGVGTVYRRFPDREMLVDALFEERVAAMLRVLDEALEIEDPWQAMVAYLSGSLEMQAADRGLKELLLSASSQKHERIESVRSQIQPRLELLLGRGQEAGVVREDITSHDLFLLQHAVCEVADFTRAAAPQAWRRTLTVVLDGLRPDRRRPSPMGAGPLSDDEMVRAISCWGPRGRRGAA